jgi:hypothetical protein
MSVSKREIHVETYFVRRSRRAFAAVPYLVFRQFLLEDFRPSSDSRMTERQLWLALKMARNFARADVGQTDAPIPN